MRSRTGRSAFAPMVVFLTLSGLALAVSIAKVSVAMAGFIPLIEQVGNTPRY